MHKNITETIIVITCTNYTNSSILWQHPQVLVLMFFHAVCIQLFPQQQQYPPLYQEMEFGTMLHDCRDQIFHPLDWSSQDRSFWKPSEVELQSWEDLHTSSSVKCYFQSPPLEQLLLPFPKYLQLQANLSRRIEFQTTWLHLFASCCELEYSRYQLGIVCICPERKKMTIRKLWFHAALTAVYFGSVNGTIETIEKKKTFFSFFMLMIQLVPDH